MHKCRLAVRVWNVHTFTIKIGWDIRFQELGWDIRFQELGWKHNKDYGLQMASRT